MSDHLVLLVGALLLYVPGSVLLVACRLRRPRAVVGMAPLMTIGGLQAAALLGQVTGLRLPAAAGVLLAAVVLGAVVVELRARSAAVTVGMAEDAWRAVRRAPVTTGLTVALVGGASWLGLSSWLRGFHGLATPPQEHDTVLHSLITAYIAHSGEAGPFEVMPVDVATGGNVSFYPAAVHTFAGLLATISGDPVTGLNATTALVLGLVAPVTLFAAAATFEPVRTRPLFAALVALLAATLYRPYFQLAHDAGILAFAMGLALAPAVAVGLAELRRRDVGTPAAVGVAALGLFAIHPSVAVVVAVVAAVVAVVGGASSPSLRRWMREHLGALGTTALVAVLFTAPWMLASVAVAGSVAGYPEAAPSAPLGEVLRSVALFRYGGFIEVGEPLYHVGFAVLFWLGVIGCLSSRRLWPLVGAWAFWAVAAILFATGFASLPGLAQLGGVFFNSWTRILSIGWVLAPAVAGLGLSVLVTRLATLRVVDRSRVRGALVPLAAAALASAFLLGSGLQYFDINQRAVADRYGDPTFYRVTPLDRQGFEYLEQHRSEVGRVLNNGNDGSTFLYVYTGIPVVNTYPLGLPQAEYGIYLMEHFRDIGTDDVVRCLVQRYDITHVMASVSSPRIPAFASPGQWVDTRMFDYAPGFQGLDSVPEVEPVFENADVEIYRVDPAILAGGNDDACTGDPAEPLPPGAGR